MIRSAALSAAFAAITLPAAAGTAFTATLAAPAEAQDTVVAASAVWTCTAETCVAELNRRTATVRTCKKVASEVGELVAFGSDGDSLSEEEIAECNSAAKY